MTLKNLTPAQFANSIGVQRSGISHIISGRNKPSLDFVLKILESFTDINESWLLVGKGEMLKSKPETNIENTSRTVLPSENLDRITQIDQEIEYEQKESSETDQINEGQEELEKKDILLDQEDKTIDNKTSRKVVKWVAFYDDDSFKEFYRP